MIVIFEGLDNCGKTTIVQILKDYYANIGIDAGVSKEFETNIGIELKKMAIEGTLDYILKAYLFAADRYIRMKSIREEDLKNKILLFDLSKTSSEYISLTSFSVFILCILLVGLFII